MKEMCKLLHPRLSNFAMIGWDFIANSSGEVVLIECNLNWSGILKYQEINGPFLGDYTEEILNAFLRK